MLDAFLPDGKRVFPAPSRHRSAVRRCHSLKRKASTVIKYKASFLMTASRRRWPSSQGRPSLRRPRADKVRIAETIAAGQEHRAPDGSFEGCSTKEDAFIAVKAT